MAHMEKYARSAVGQLCQHYERKKLPDGSYVKFGNEDIDITRTHLNYNLAPDRTLKGQIDFINQRCSEVKCMNRKDVNVMVSWVVTLPKEFPQERSREFFEETYKFLNARYGGEKNVISSYVHMDETQPHTHYAFVPVVTDKKSGIDKVSAKEAITKGDLLTFHKDLEKRLYQHFGFEVGVLNGATKGGNLTVKELKLQTSVENLAEKEAELKANVQNYQDLSVAVDDVSDIGRISKLNKNTVVVPLDEYTLLQEQAKSYCVNQAEIMKIRESWREIEEERKRLKQREKQIKADYDKSRKEAAEYYKEAEQLWDMATMPDTFQKRYNEMERLISEYVPKIAELESKLNNSVPQSEYNKISKAYNTLLFRFQTLEQQFEMAKSQLKAEKENNDPLKTEIAEKKKIIGQWAAAHREAYIALANVAKAVGMLKHDNGDYKVESLSPKQSRLIDSLADYIAYWAKQDGYPDLAGEVEKEIGISEGIQDKINERTPKVKSRGLSL